jgi:hypothetical protein
MSQCTDACVAAMKGAVDQAFLDYENSGHADYKDATALKNKLVAAINACDDCISKC